MKEAFENKESFEKKINLPQETIYKPWTIEYSSWPLSQTWFKKDKVLRFYDWNMLTPPEIKQIACMILVLKKSEKNMVAPRFDPWTYHTWSKLATTEPTLYHTINSKYRGYTLRIWQVSFILSCFKPVHMILNKKYNETQFSKKSRPK